MIGGIQTLQNAEGIALGAVAGAGQAVERFVRECPAALVIADLGQARIVAESDVSLALFGCARPRIGEALSRQWSRRADYEGFLRSVREIGAIERIETRLQRNSGEQFWCAVSARAIEIDARPLLYLHMLDLSDQIAAREELSWQRDALHDAEKLSALGQVLAGISHELNNPLSVLTGQALMLKEKATDPATAQRAERIFNAANRCSRIVRSFLDLARGKPADPVAVSLADLVVEAVDARVDSLRRAGIDVVLELPRELPRIMADPDQIRQVVINLLVNAEHALRDEAGPRRVSILARAAQGCVSLNVSDTGPGVSSEISSRIFEPLFSTKPPGEGTGLGLALCRRIMEVHRGTITLASSSAAGTTFRLIFPRLESNSGPAEVVLRRPVTTGGNGLYVLLVDDDAKAGKALAERLAAHGHGVEFVQSAFVGLERLRRVRFDVILSRAGLGDGGVTAQLHAMEQARPGASHGVIFLIGRSADTSFVDQLDRAERPYLEEPFEPGDLFDTMELILLRPGA
jgi:signal transduction histidine kinase